MILNSVYVAGSAMSLVGLLLVVFTGLQGWQKVLVSALLGLSFVASVYVAYALSKNTTHLYSRLQTVKAANALIRCANERIVLLAGDMSWAPDHVIELRNASKRGKQVDVLYPQSKSVSAESSCRLLLDNGIVPQMTDIDSGIRALFIDPDDNDGVVFLVRKQKATNPNGANRYYGRVYSQSDDPELLRTIGRVCTILREHHRV